MRMVGSVAGHRQLDPVILQPLQLPFSDWGICGHIYDGVFRVHLCFLLIGVNKKGLHKKEGMEHGHTNCWRSS